MPANTDKPGRAPSDRKAPKPSEIVDAQLDAEARDAELLADLPELLPASRFRYATRVEFENLMFEALKSGAFGDDIEASDEDEAPAELVFDPKKPEDIERLQTLRSFIGTLDTFFESIAVNKEDYVDWSEGKKEEHFIALFDRYRSELGE